MGLPLASARWSQVEGRRTSSIEASRTLSHVSPTLEAFVSSSFSIHRKKTTSHSRHPTPSYTLPQWLLDEKNG